MTWPEAATAIVGIVGGLAGGAGAVYKLAAAWTKKAIALGQKAEAEREAATQLAELRASFARFMERMQDAEKRLDRLEIRAEERDRARRDTRGVPIPSED